MVSKILEGNRDKMSKNLKSGTDPIDAFTELYMGIGVKKAHVKQALKITNLEEKEFDDFDSRDTKEFAKILRKISKTTLEKWNSELTSDELDEILWHVKELKNTCEKFSHK